MTLELLTEIEITKDVIRVTDSDQDDDNVIRVTDSIGDDQGCH